MNFAKQKAATKLLCHDQFRAETLALLEHTNQYAVTSLRNFFELCCEKQNPGMGTIKFMHNSKKSPITTICSIGSLQTKVSTVKLAANITFNP